MEPRAKAGEQVGAERVGVARAVEAQGSAGDGRGDRVQVDAEEEGGGVEALAQGGEDAAGAGADLDADGGAERAEERGLEGEAVDWGGRGRVRRRGR